MWTREPGSIMKYYATLLEARRKTKRVENNDTSTSKEEHGRRVRKTKPSFSTLNITLNAASLDYTVPSPPSSISSERSEKQLDICEPTVLGNPTEDKQQKEAKSSNIESMLKKVLELVNGVTVNQNSMTEAMQSVSSQQQLLFEELDIIKIKLPEMNRSQPTTEIPTVEVSPFDLVPLRTVEEIDDFTQY
ncbi:hypothetical protein ILUMI_09627 [Ignelater luminosus]|uniref:Uncharacterized protein n=1 Tax=Ignelater luminosus TaxID=2038154 RepID=A0A8K0GFT0_IGNLU|nr:hypothetical protein ILUMI_09627 [Ignelater luminosus]